MTRRLLRACLAAVLLLASVTAPARSEAPATPAQRISVPGLELKKGERVKEFEVIVTKGRIAALPRVPVPWRIKLVNDDDFTARLVADALQGTGEFTAAYFDGFIDVVLYEGGKIVVKIETTMDWEKTERRLTFDDGQLRKAPIAP